MHNLTTSMTPPSKFVGSGNADLGTYARKEVRVEVPLRPMVRHGHRSDSPQMVTIMSKPNVALRLLPQCRIASREPANLPMRLRPPS